jgi:glycosyltransferase involved in cell wall biosynthesis
MLAEILPILIPQLENNCFEAVVIDNCPNGSAKDLVEYYRTKTTFLSYIHQPKAGVVHARNAGVAAAQGTYILFLDDDEIPCRNWLSAFKSHAELDCTVAFGRIITRYAVVPDPKIKPMLDRIFNRDYALQDNADITAYHAELGTGNSMFHKERCFPKPNPFDDQFNRIGGEDVWLIKGLVKQGVALSWVPDAKVEELVPENRMTLEYLKLRRYNQGRLRCLFHYKHHKWADSIQVSKWMAVGVLQTIGYGLLYIFSTISNNSKKAHYDIQIQGGIGKLFWWKNKDINFYGGDQN